MFTLTIIIARFLHPRMACEFRTKPKSNLCSQQADRLTEELNVPVTGLTSQSSDQATNQLINYRNQQTDQSNGGYEEFFCLLGFNAV
jgi:hypothetical protein